MWCVKSAGVFAVGAAWLCLAAGHVMAGGGGQGEHDADSGVGAVHYGGGYRYGGGGVGQAQEGPAGPNGAYVDSGINTQGIGQSQHDVGGFLQSAPVFEASPLSEQRSLIAVQPENGYRVATDPHYRVANGMWFYQMPNDRWVRWENGAWMDYNSTAIAQQNSGSSAARTFSYEPSPDTDHAANKDKSTEQPAEKKANRQGPNCNP